jgi:signal transduction histidine kinase
MDTPDHDFLIFSPAEIKAKSIFSPFKLALTFALAYFVICSFYIWVSSFLAAHLSASISDLQRIETIKGLIFILITTLSIFGMLWYLLHRLAIDENSKLTQKNELIKSQSQSASGVLASAVAHDINNILSVLNFYCHELAHLDEASRHDPKIQQRISAALDDLKNLTQRLMYLGKENIPAEFKQLNLVQLVKDTLEFARKHHKIQQKTISYSGIEVLAVLGNEYTLRQLFINLLFNAAAAARSQVEVRVLLQNDFAVLEVHDDGNGIPPEKRKSIFQPYYTSKVEGTGLGLLSVQVYTEIHHGRINLVDSHLGGACFQIVLPIVIK